MEKILESVKYINRRTNDFSPEIAIVLGSGLGALPDDYDCIKIPYIDIPNFHKSSIPGHKGQLCFCETDGKKVVMMQGRYHFYEGYSGEQITFPIKVMKHLGVKKIILTNAAGAVNDTLKTGDIMLISDHINLMGFNPLIGKNDDNLGTRFPDMSEVYNKSLRTKILECAKKNGQDLKQGIYMAMSGPSYETPAEVKMARILGADAVGMSTVPEAIVANYCGIDVIGLSCITNYAAGVSAHKLDHSEVIATANKIESKFKNLVKQILRNV